MVHRRGLQAGCVRLLRRTLCLRAPYRAVRPVRGPGCAPLVCVLLCMPRGCALQGWACGTVDATRFQLQHGARERARLCPCRFPLDGCRCVHRPHRAVLRRRDVQRRVHRRGAQLHRWREEALSWRVRVQPCRRQARRGGPTGVPPRVPQATPPWRVAAGASSIGRWGARTYRGTAAKDRTTEPPQGMHRTATREVTTMIRSTVVDRTTGCGVQYLCSPVCVRCTFRAVLS